MSMKSRKKKGFARSLIALMLCCVCLLAAMPISAIALEADATPVSEETVTEQQTEETTDEPETTGSTDSSEIVLYTAAPETETASEPETETEMGMGSEAETETGMGSEAETETGMGSEAETETGMGSETETETEMGSETEAETGMGSETETGIGTKTETETKENPVDLSLYDQLLACQTASDMYALLGESDLAEVEALTYDELTALIEYVGTLDEDEYTTELLMGLYSLRDNQASLIPGNPDDNNQDNNQGSDSGNMNHIEINVASAAAVTIDGKTYTANVTITTSDTFTVTATQNGVVYTGFTQGTNSKGNGSNSGATVKIGGSYPTGTYASPVIYTITTNKSVTFDIDGTEMTFDVKLAVTTNYWDFDNNECPGIGESSNSQNSTWRSGKYIGGSGIDITITGSTVEQTITAGKLAISKTVTGEENNTASFQFYLQNTAGKYLTFTGTSCNNETEWSDTLISSCYITVTAGEIVTLTDIPVGVYRITEVQSDGYVITDAEGNESADYTKDFIIETKKDTEIPIANFTNKKLEDEAGIKIKKAASGLTTTYPNPTVSIYKASDVTDGVPNEGAKTVWSGELTTNSDDFIYLKTTLEAGEIYVVVETGEEVDGYTCAASLTVDNTSASGMTFTAVDGQVHEIVLKNTYTQRPTTADLTITKKLDGNMYSLNDTFAFTVTYGNTTETFTTAGSEEGISTKIEDVTIGETVTINEVTGSYDLTTISITYIDADGKTVAVSYEEVKDDDGNLIGVSFTMPESDVTVSFTNKKEIIIDTGVILETLPYVIILAIVAVGAVLMIKRRRNRDDD